MTPIPLSDTSCPPQFPCWLYAEGKWLHCYGDFPDCFVVRSEVTHWHPDQPDAPTERPEQFATVAGAEVAPLAKSVTAGETAQNNRQSGTPRTDLEAYYPEGARDKCVPADFARTLERELAASRAECEEQARLNGMGAEREAGLHGRIAELERELATTKAALSAQANYQRSLRADRDRLDWLGAAKCAYFHEGPFCWRINEDSATDGDTIRAAIDAAMQKQEGGV